MKRTTLRQRSSLLLALWFAVCAIVLGALAFAGLARVREDVLAQQELIARAAARSLDRALAGTLRDLDRMGSGLDPEHPGVAAELRAFRLRSPSTAPSR